MCELVLDAPALVTIEGEIIEASRYQDGTGYALLIQVGDGRRFIGPAPGNLGWRSLTRLIGRRARLQALVASGQDIGWRYEGWTRQERIHGRRGYRLHREPLKYTNPVNFVILGYKRPPDRRKIII